MYVVGLVIIIVVIIVATVHVRRVIRGGARTSIDDLIETDSFGAVLVARGDDIVYEKYINNTKTTKFRVHSMTKPITAATIMLLVRDNGLKLEDTLHDVGGRLLGLRGGEHVTIGALLDHRSGVYDLVSDLVYNKRPPALFDKCAAENEFVMPGVRTYIDEVTGPSTTYDGDFVYNNTGYDLLGMVIEQVSGMSAREYIRKNIFLPLGMTASSFHGSSIDADPMETPKRVGVREQYGSFGANAFIICTARDYLKFLCGVKELLRKRAYDKYERLYFFTTTDGHRRIMHHNGGGDFTHAFMNGDSVMSAPLSRSYFMKYMDTGWTMILLQNYGQGSSPLVSLSYDDYSAVTAKLARHIAAMT